MRSGDNADRRVLFDLGRANNRVSGWNFEQAGPMAVQGYQQTGERIYFYARLNAKIDRIETERTTGSATAMRWSIWRMAVPSPSNSKSGCRL